MTGYDIVVFSTKQYIRVYETVFKCDSRPMEKKKRDKKTAERDKQPRKPDERFQQLPLFTAFTEVLRSSVP